MVDREVVQRQEVATIPATPVALCVDSLALWKGWPCKAGKEPLGDPVNLRPSKPPDDGEITERCHFGDGPLHPGQSHPADFSQRAQARPTFSFTVGKRQQ